MFIELHIIQNFAPSCLNRDDTNAPKDCTFGGFRRARISSQCLKRAVRRHFRDANLLPREQLAVRTKRIVGEVADRLAARERDPDAARAVAQLALGGIGIGVVDGDKTEYLLYLGDDEIGAVADVCDEHWETLAELVAGGGDDGGGQSKARKQKKKGAKDLVPKEIRAQVDGALATGKAADLALFGRMLADLSARNVDAACQVAHALSTHEVSMEMDFYTAVDDLRPEDTQGADMMGVVEFNSSCFYRYALVDMGTLTDNLHGDDALARRTLRAFVEAAIAAVPTGKQNSMAAHNPPIYVRVLARNGGQPWNLANAFVAPVRVRRDGDLVGESIAAFERHLGEMRRMYGDEGVVLDCWSSLHDADSTPVPELLSRVEGALG